MLFKIQFRHFQGFFSTHCFTVLNFYHIIHVCIFQITPDVAQLLNDKELEEYLPLHGDRLRVRQHLGTINKQSAKKKRLYKKLEQSLARKNKNNVEHTDSSDEDMNRPFGNQNAVKATRLIEIGWMHQSNQ